MNKKITFFMSSMGRGGAERVVSILSRKYCELGWRVDICMLLHNISEYALDERVQVLDLSNDGTNKVNMIFSIRKYMKKEKPDIVVPFLSKISALFYIATFGMNITPCRVIVSERIDPYAVDYPNILRIIIKRSFEKADGIVFQTKRAQSYYSRKIQEKSCIIGNPVTMNIAKATISEDVIITAGRLEQQKNQKMLINAFEKIAEKYPEYELHIFGEGKLRKDLENLILEKRMGKRIKLMGSRADYHEELAKADLFVLPSNYEGLSNALLEAMMMGVPCISTECAGSDEIIDNGINGILVPVGNETKMAHAMDILISDTSMKKKIGSEAKKSVRNFEIEKIIVAWQNVLEGR